MKTSKTLVKLITLIIFTLFAFPVFGVEDIKKGVDSGENIICQKCEVFAGLESLKEFASDNVRKVVYRGTNIIRHLSSSSAISQDIVHLPYLRETKKGRLVLWYTLFEF